MSSVSYSINLNGEKIGFIRPTRDIKQRDPLSSYLFLICAEGLTSLLKKAERNKLISGVKIAKDSPAITHILFVDDFLLFCKANAGDARITMKILEIYGRASR